MASTYQSEKTFSHSGQSMLEQDLQLVGDISFSTELHVLGSVNGNIVAPLDSNAELFLQHDSEVHGEIRVPNIVIAGTVNGDIFAPNQLILKPNAIVNGNVHYTKLEINSGAELNGVLSSLGENTSSEDTL